MAAAGVAVTSSCGWMERVAAATANNPQRRRSCILLWMNGGPATIDLWDLKPGHINGGPFREIATAVPGIRISEHLPRLATQMRDMAIIRSMSTREGDHDRGTYLMHTGQLPQGPIQYPTLGSLLSKELGSEESALPNFVSIYRTPFVGRSYGPGFLGPRYAPLVVGATNQPQQNNNEQSLAVPDLRPAVADAQMDSRIRLHRELEQDFVARHHGVSGHSHQTAYERAVRLMRTSAASAFNLEEESDQKREQYGRNQFGQGCLLARRLVERGVPFVEVNYSNNGADWDTHNDNFTAVAQRCGVVDQAWGTLMDDLRASGLLKDTLIVWMGEFGRTPRINQQRGRDHWPNSWATVLAGGGIRGGQVYGQTSADGTVVEMDRPTSVPDFIATICKALGIDPTKQNMSNVGRPIRIADPNARAIPTLIA
jgi:uncharacterized protein (DUF1501 family)